MSALLQPRPGRTACCAACASACQGTLYGPARIVGEAGLYRREHPGPFCETCHRQLWRGYLDAVRERMALVRLSLRLGYAARRSDLARETDDSGRQLALFGKVERPACSCPTKHAS